MDLSWLLNGPQGDSNVGRDDSTPKPLSFADEREYSPPFFLTRDKPVGSFHDSSRPWSQQYPFMQQVLLSKSFAC